MCYLFQATARLGERRIDGSRIFSIQPHLLSKKAQRLAHANHQLLVDRSARKEKRKRQGNRGRRSGAIPFGVRNQQLGQIGQPPGVCGELRKPVVSGDLARDENNIARPALPGRGENPRRFFRLRPILQSSCSGYLSRARSHDLFPALEPGRIANRYLRYSR